MKSNKSTGVVIGILLVIIGIGYVGNIFEVWNFTLFFPGWWSMFLIVPAIAMIARDGMKPINIVLLGIGAIILITSKKGALPEVVSKLLPPILIMALGLAIVFRGNLSAPFGKQQKNVPSHVAIFGGSTPNYNGKTFRGAFCTAVFGGVDLLLGNATIENGAVIDALALFGGVDIKLPDNVNVETSSLPIFGGTGVAKNRTFNENNPTVYVNAVCIFGGVDIK
mgnify:CR=1